MQIREQARLWFHKRKRKSSEIRIPDDTEESQSLRATQFHALGIRGVVQRPSRQRPFRALPPDYGLTCARRGLSSLIFLAFVDRGQCPQAPRPVFLLRRPVPNPVPQRTPMAEPLPLRTTMTFAYGEPRELAPGVLRIVANNPNHFTFKGTNTYLVGTRSLALIDPGPEDPDHLAAILKAVGAAADQPRADHPHAPRPHRRHAGAAGRDRRQDRGLRPPRPQPRHQAHQPLGRRVRRQGLRPRHPARRRQRLEGDGWAFTAVHTPGHAPDHLCFALEGTEILFSGDHVMGWNTSVVAPPEGNMGAYMRSLQRLIERSDERLLSRPWRPDRGAAAPGQGLPAAPAHARAVDPRMHPQRHQYGRAPSCRWSTRASTPSSSTLRLFLCSRTLST